MTPDETYDACVRELRDFARSAGFSEVVLGLSGGIDSAVCAVMCVDAFGADRVHAVLMPGPYSSDHSVIDAQEEAVALGIPHQVISIGAAYDAFASMLAESCGDAWGGLPSQNTQARCRMVVLMALSNAHGWMVVNTGNKSEAAMGYSTLYGDTAGAFAPLGGLYKTDVYAVARARNARAKAAGEAMPIPARVLEKAPSAELAPHQSDEAALGIPYSELDPLLIDLFEHGRTPEAIAKDPAQTRTAQEISDLAARVNGFAYKRAVEPPFPQAKFY